MVQIGRRGTVQHLFQYFKKFSKITEIEFQNSGPSFFASVSPVRYKKNLTGFEMRPPEAPRARCKQQCAAALP